MNEWTKGANFLLNPVSGRQIVIDNEIFEEMIKGPDGTYQYSFTITKVGKITISIMLATQGGVLAEYFGNNGLSGNNIYTRRETIPYFYYDWGQGAVYPNGSGDYASGIFHFYLKAPTTGTISYSVIADDRGAFNIGKKFY